MKTVNIRRFYFREHRAICLGVRLIGCGREKALAHNNAKVTRFGITLAVRGRAAITIGDRTFTIRTGDLFVYFPRDTFSLKPNPDYEELWINFDGAVPRQYMHDFPRQVPKKNAAAVAAAIRQIWKLSGEKKTDFPAMALHAWNIVGRLAQTPGERPLKKHGPGADPVQEILDMVQADPAEHWDFRDLAEQQGIGYSLLRLRVKQLTGLPLGEFQNRERINKACVLLTKGYSVKQTASAVGISNQLYFSRFFKKRTKQTPSGYRNGHAKPGSDAV
jgi:AraC-like DNA-binding protein